MLETRDTRASRIGWGARIRGRAARSALTWAGLLVSAVFAYFAVRNVHLGDVWDGIRTSNLWWLAPALAVLALAVYVKALRWRFLFAPETRPSTGAAVKALLVCYFFNSILPARAGEAARVLALRQKAGTSRVEAAATVVIERVYDVLVLLVLLFVAVPWLPEVSWLRAAALLAVVVAGGLAALIAILAVFGVRPLHAVLKPLARLPFLSLEAVAHAGESVGRGLAAARRPKLVAGAFCWTALGWLAVIVSTWLVMRGFDLELPIAAALLVVVATNLVQILPSSPSALGVFEAATLVALSAYGVDEATALSFALVLHALSVLPFLVAGIFMLRGPLSIRRGANVEKLALRPTDRPVDTATGRIGAPNRKQEATMSQRPGS